MGWGRLNRRPSPGGVEYYGDRLRQLLVPLQSDDTCESSYGIGTKDLPYRPDSRICAGASDGVTGPCFGDSGGPLIVGAPGAWLDAGILDGGDGCAERGYYEIYTRVDRIRAVRPDVERVECDGEAILFATGPWARLPADLPDTLALAALDVCGAPALAARLLRPGLRVLVLGAGKSGALVLAQARESLAGTGEAVAADRSQDALDAVERAGLCDRTLRVDATDAVGTLAAVVAAGGPFDVVVNCATVPGTEMASILAARDGGTVLFFSMATSFTAAALGAEGVGKDATILVGNGYVPGHADLTLGLVRRHAGLRALFEARYAAPR
jgi:hypothetical protein